MFLETETLSEALSFAKLKDLPKKFNPELGLTWILAIALIKKKNLMNAYAIVEQRADGLIQYKKTFGRLSPIDGLISIHPYMYVDEEALGMAMKANRRTIAMHYAGYADEIIDSDDEKFKAYQLQYAMDMQKLNMNQEKPRFGKSVVEEAEEAVNPVIEEELKDNEAIATVEDEGECVIEVEDAKEAFKQRRGRNARKEE
ncbi:hypothetical protein [Phocaeicola vulgatus]|jgi:hypothetical protein|uniref:hypothetical protein n=1 Tax=Phocaeicola vulgatus TaxID=821 RepID=UPI00189956B7|nr:hypothetical protein [Phocaeicola vulgatus]